MSKTNAIALGMFTAWPCLYLLLALSMIFSIKASSSSGSYMPPSAFNVVIIIHLLTILDGWALVIVYLAILITTDRVPRDRKFRWGILLFVANVIAMPFFWYWYVWKDSTRAPSGQAAQPDAPHLPP